MGKILERQENKDELLTSLLSNGKYKYKRYDGLPLRYAGGKSRAVGYIVERIPDDVSKVMSPFIGGASIEIACSNELNMEVVGYDIFDILVNYWQEQISNPEGLYDILTQWKPTKEQYKDVKERLKKHWNNESIIDNSTELAAHYWFNHNLSYGPGFLGWMSSIYQSEKRYSNLINKVKNFRVNNLVVDTGTFEDTIENHKNDFLYCDPPYYLDEDSKMFRGIYPQRNFPVHHNNFDHEKLRDMLYNHDERFILSYNDCSTIREWYRDYKIIEVAWQYSMGQGETRIGKNRINNGSNTHVKKSHEVLIIKE